MATYKIVKSQVSATKICIEVEETYTTTQGSVRMVPPRRFFFPLHNHNFYEAVARLMEGAASVPMAGLTLAEAKSLHDRRFISFEPNIPVYRKWEHNIREVEEAYRRNRLIVTVLGKLVLEAVRNVKEAAHG